MIHEDYILMNRFSALIRDILENSDLIFHVKAQIVIHEPLELWKINTCYLNHSIDGIFVIGAQIN